MGRRPRNYANASIYEIRSPSHPDLIYVGSTCDSLSKRWYQHKLEFKKSVSSHQDKSAFGVLQYTDSYIVFHEHFPCESKDELAKRTNEVMRTLSGDGKNVLGYTAKRTDSTCEQKKCAPGGRQVVECDCGATVCIRTLKRHLLTQKHLRNTLSQPPRPAQSESSTCHPWQS